MFESNVAPHPSVKLTKEEEGEDEKEDNGSKGENDSKIFEVEEVMDICYGDPKESSFAGLYYNVELLLLHYNANALV